MSTGWSAGPRAWNLAAGHWAELTLSDPIPVRGNSSVWVAGLKQSSGGVEWTDDLQPGFPRSLQSLEDTQKTLSEPHGLHGRQGTAHVFISFPGSSLVGLFMTLKVTPAPKDEGE